jgi:uncharacterized protein (DUF1330 family)
VGEARFIEECEGTMPKKLTAAVLATLVSHLQGRRTMTVLSKCFAAALLCASIAPLAAQTAPTPGAYVIIEFAIRDQAKFQDYGQKAPPTVAQYGGRFVVRGAKPEMLKGDAPKGPFLILAFDNLQQAKTWASSPEYTALVPLRDEAADSRVFIVQAASP